MYSVSSTSITVTNVNTNNKLSGKLIYNPDGNLFYALGANLSGMSVGDYQIFLI
jgi:hypothetical protein